MSPSVVKFQHRLKSPASQAGQIGSIPRGRHDSHGFSTTRWPTSKPEASGPSSTTSATTSWPMTWGNEQKPLMALSLSPSPKSSRICLESDPQMPVSRGRVTSQSGRSGRASGMSRSATGVMARFAHQRVGVRRRRPRLGVGAEHQRLHGRTRVQSGAPSSNPPVVVGNVRRGPASARTRPRCGRWCRSSSRRSPG